MKKYILILLVVILVFFEINMLILNNKSIAEESEKETNEDVYDVILFWGQSNMVGSCLNSTEDRFDPNDDESVKAFSKATGIDEDILKNNTQSRNLLSIEQEDNTAYEYMYSTNTLEEITADRNTYGENLQFNSVTSDGEPTELSVGTSNIALSTSRGTNMIPQFCKTYYQNTGHKVVAVFAALGGKPIRQFLPYDDEGNDVEEKKYIYEAIKTKYLAAIKYMDDNNLKIGNRLYVVFQGEADIARSTEVYKRDFLKVHNNLKNDLGIQKGAICETSTQIGRPWSYLENVHNAQEELIEENDDIILGSSYSYDRFVSQESDYENCTTKVTYDEKGDRLDYDTAFTNATYSVDYPQNTIHLTSASLSQVGKDVAEAYSTIESIEMQTLPTKKEYIQNYEKLDLTGAKLKINYDNLESDIIDITSDMVTGFDNSELGKQTLTVTYKGLTTKFNVVINKKELTNITINSKPTKTEYIQNYEELDVTGGKIDLQYNDASKETIDITSDMISGFDNTQLGKQTLTVNYDGKTTTYEINIVEKQITGIELKTKPTKVEYTQNYDLLDVTGGKIEVSFNDTSKQEIDLTQEMVTGFDNSKLGTQKLTITYEGKTTTYDVTVVEKKIVDVKIDKEPTKLEYIQNYGKLDITGGTLKITYNDETTEIINILEEMVEGFDNSKLGKQILTVKYGEFTNTFDINVVAKSIESIKISKFPDKIEYIQNEEQLNVEGGKLKIIYNDETTEEIDITEDMVTGFDNKTAGTIQLTVTYGEFTDSFNVTIIAKPIENKTDTNTDVTEPKVEDTTVSDKVIPKAGTENIILIIIILLIIISIYMFYKTRKYKDII